MNLIQELEKKFLTGTLSVKRDEVYELNASKFWELVAKVRGGLVSKGIKKGDCVGIHLPNSPEWVILDFAIMGMGAVTVPLSIKSTKEQLTHMISSSNCKLVFSTEKDQIIGLEKSPEENLKELFGKKISCSLVDENEPATIGFTSGSTGLPKGVVLSHKNLLFNTKAQPFPTTKEDSLISYLPLSHTFERSCGVCSGLYTDMSIRFLDDTSKLLQTLEEYKPTCLLCVPLVLEKIKKKILKHPIKKQIYRFAPSIMGKLILKKMGGRIKWIICGGAPLSKSLIEFIERTNLPAYQGYGMTETAPLLAANNPQKNKLGSVGPPLSGVEVKIENNHILVKSPGLFIDYLPPERKQDRLKEDWFDTGDLGSLKDGFLYVEGRKDDLIVLQSGKKIYAHVIEALVEDAGIEQAIAYGGERGVSCLIFSEKDDSYVKGCIDEVNNGLAKHDMITHWSRMNEMTIENGYLTSALKKSRKKVVAELVK